MKKLKAFAMASICLFFANSYSQNYDAQEVELQQKYFNISDHFHKTNIFVGNHYYKKDFYTGINNFIYLIQNLTRKYSLGF